MNVSKHLTLLSIGVLSLLLLSCQEGKTQTPTNLSIEITDSIRIDYLGLLDLMNIQPKMERLLLHDRQRGITLMTDFNGNPLLNMDKGGDQKDSYGRFLWSSANIKENEHISLVSQKGFFEFDSKGNLAKHKPFEKEVPFFAGRAAAD